MKHSICKTCLVQFEYANKGRARVFCSVECYRLEQRKSTYKKEKKKLDFNVFLEKAKLVHGGRYKYKENKNLLSNGNISAICEKHGEFSQLIHNHLKGHGCKKCGIEATIDKQKFKYKEFIRKSQKAHGGEYEYNHPESFTGMRDKVTITCKIHGEFRQDANAHAQGKGCIKCGINKSRKSKRYTQEEIVAKAIEKHGNKYCYVESNYTGIEDKIKIKCNEHGFFHQTASHHLNGSGCPSCAKSTAAPWRKSSYVKLCNEKHGGKSSIYLIKCRGNGESFYKVGITSKSIQDRFRNKKDIPYDYETIFFISGLVGAIWDLEKRVHKALKDYRYNPLLSFGGETECFSEISKPVNSMFKKMANGNQLQLIC